MTRFTRLTSAFGLGSSLFGLAQPSLASPNYPDMIAEILEMSCAPPCTICHIDNNGGVGTVTRTFGVAMRDAGLRAGGSNQLSGLLEELENDAIDSDGDGVGDVSELRADQNPSREDPHNLCTAEVQYGCLLQPPTKASAQHAAWPLAVVLLSACLWWRRRRR